MPGQRLPALIPLLALCLFSFALVFSVGGASTRVVSSFHGLHHSAYVVQIQNGIVPPTNPSSMGAPVNFYWAWHALLALGSEVFERTPFEMSLLSNAFGLAAVLCSLWLVARRSSTSLLVRLGFCLLPFFILNPVGLTQFALQVVGVLLPEWIRSVAAGQPDLLEHLRDVAHHHDSLRITNHNLVQLFPRFDFMQDLPLSDRAGNLINKFFNFNSFPLALGFFAMGSVSLLEEGRSLGLRAGLVFVTALATAILSPLVAAGFGCVVAACLLVSAREGFELYRERDRRIFRAWVLRTHAPAFAALLGVVFALPHLLPIMRAYGGETRIYGDGPALLAHARYLGWALLPSLAIYLVALLRFGSLAREARINLVAGLSLALAAMLLSVPIQDPNEYKWVLLSTLPTSFLAMALWRQSESAQPDPTPAQRRFSTGFGVLLSAAGTAGILVTVLIYQLSPWSHENPYDYVDGRIEVSSAPGDASRAALGEAYRWLRDHTPTDSFVMEVPVDKDALELSVVAQRRVVVAQASTFTQIIPYQEELVTRVEDVITRIEVCQLDEGDLASLFAIPAPWPDHVYALVPLVRVQARSCPGELAEGVTLEFDNDHHAIYRLESGARTPRLRGSATRS